MVWNTLRIRTVWIWLLVVAISVYGWPFFSNGHVKAQSIQVNPVQTVTHQETMLVKFKANVDAAAVVRQLGGQVVAHLPALDVYQIAPLANPMNDMLRIYNKDSRVRYAELNQTATVATAGSYPNDPLYSAQWHLPDMNVDDVWNDVIGGTKGSSNVVIAVLDTGVDSSHPDLSERDKMLTGRNTVGSFNDTDSVSTNTEDINGHGTHVAGIAAAGTNNDMGVAGVCPDCRILPVKVMGDNGSGTIFDIAEGLSWIAGWMEDAKQETPNLKVVINMSLGVPNGFGLNTLQGAIDQVYSKGAILFGSSGNDGRKTIRYPAASNHVIGVASSTQTRARSSFSNMGSHIDLAAPGSAILATVIAREAVQGQRYAYKQGTSMAAPNAAGVAGLIWSKYPDLTQDQLEWVLTKTARAGLKQKLARNTNKPLFNTSFGYGIVDAQAALTAAAALSNEELFQGLVDATVTSSTFRNTTDIRYTTMATGYASVDVYQSDGVTFYRSLLKDNLLAAGQHSVRWTVTGKSAVPTGNYVIRVSLRNDTGKADVESLSVRVDRTAEITEPIASGTVLDRTKEESLQVTFTAQEALNNVQVTVIDAQNRLVQTIQTPIAMDLNEATLAPSALTVTWNGTSHAKPGEKVGDGRYRFAIKASDQIGNTSTHFVAVRVSGEAPVITKAVADTFSYRIGRPSRSMKLPFDLKEPAKWAQIVIRNSGQEVVHTITVNEGSGLAAGRNFIVWNGYRPHPTISGALLANGGTYTYTINVKDDDDVSATPVTGSFILK